MENMHGFNTVRKILASIELSKTDAKKLNSFEDVKNAILNDTEPQPGKEFKGSGAAGSADFNMNDFANAEVFESRGVPFIHLSMTFLEFYNTDNDGDFVDGSDYDATCDFSDDQKQIIKEFCKF